MPEQTKPKKEKLAEEEEFQKKYSEYNLYKGQLEALINELNTVNAASANFSTTKITLENLGKAEKNPDILVPIGGDTFLNASVTDTKKALIGIGAGILVKKEIPEAIKSLDKQTDNLKQAHEKIEEGIKNLDSKIQELEPELEKYIAKTKKEKI